MMPSMNDPQHVLAELERAPGETKERLRAGESDAVTLLAALASATTAQHRAFLCDALGARAEPSSVDALIGCLQDESAKVRSAAADALAKLRDQRAGAPLLARVLLPEPDGGAHRMMVAALGAVGHRPAVPVLIELLQSAHPSMRGSAAWSLGALRAPSAALPLRLALERELASYPAERMREALRAITAS